MTTPKGSASQSSTSVASSSRIKVGSDPKGQLLGYCQKNGKKSPVYNANNLGLDHEPQWKVSVILWDNRKFSSTKATKGEAEQEATKQALYNL